NDCVVPKLRSYPGLSARLRTFWCIAENVVPEVVPNIVRFARVPEHERLAYIVVHYVVVDVVSSSADQFDCVRMAPGIGFLDVVDQIAADRRDPSTVRVTYDSVGNIVDHIIRDSRENSWVDR